MQFHASRYLLVAGSLFISQLVMSQVILETCGKNECTGKLEIISQEFGTCKKMFKCDAGEYHDECGSVDCLSGCKRVGFGPKNSAQTQPDTYVGLGRVGSNLNICCPDPNPSWDFLGSGRQFACRVRADPIVLAFVEQL
ncbi:uncharacterized protein PGTG_02603 [Puccinia graminis f. sp. tritici CRL 75-36-700-3]|uniref:Uncharacterized protein n=1 Tax=Puccinia graminis f. sp. tritici (strain CRL 75-36-700-3 / race SCCL) TaxID=418459 RepID=E3JVT7_PUCGT|nr:uncharacterized protein PGTG_02603 [Puccinia graminis f. sp. tritici CRL 75-36-700-3]EFP76162.1 hypothetical protein PGTG_02603 [Puccinia graminis f. sp. tritici CRL 75-36-700-3]